MTKIDERQLAAQVASGGREACERFLDAHEGRVYNLVRRMVGADDADDVAQDALVEIINSIGGFRGKSRLSTWVYRVAANVCLEHRRKRRPEFVPIDGDCGDAMLVDLESRIRNKRAEERQYLELMNRAKRVTDIMAVSNELYRVRGEIEEAVGRLKYLRSSAAMSTINLQMAEKAKSKPVQSSLHRTWDNAIASLIASGRSLAGLIIWIVVYSPFWGLPIAAWLVLKRRAAHAQG